jgi:predicted dehydrogenase
MAKNMKIGVLGCGDFLRWQSGALEKSTSATVAKLFDPDTARAGKYAEKLNASVASSGDEIIEDNDIDIV